MHINPERKKKFERVVAARQTNLTVVLENVHDMHNIGAVLRSCDSVGIHEIFVLITEEGLLRDKLQLGKKSSGGTRKWVDVHFYTDPELCFGHVRQKYQTVWGTQLGASSKSVFELDLTASVALLFGNERDGLSEYVQPYIDGNFLVPQVGMAESLNISVACAVTLYEAYRQRQNKGWYDANNPFPKEEQKVLLNEYLERHDSRTSPNFADRINP
ncbi:MAG: RNA methyltransferase [Saprospiraceae bacterium]|nr:RNA methyltransferase [Saprospiraceae bacterium]